MTKTLAFPCCWVHIDEDARFLQTVFNDGRSLTSVPAPAKDTPTARAYGYGDDWTRLWREHDLLHHWIGFLLGQQHSPTIWSECHADHPAALQLWARQQEEEFVAHVHRWLNLGLWVPELWPLERCGLALPGLREQTLRVLRYEVERVGIIKFDVGNN